MEQPKKTIFDQLAVFSYRKWLFIIPLAIGAVIGLAVSISLPKYYSSTTLILVEEQQVPEQYVTPTDKTPFGQRLNVITQQILSRTKLQQIIREFNLYQVSTPGLITRAASLFSSKSEDHPLSEDLIENMRKDVKFEVAADVNPPARRGAPNSGGNAFTITYTGTDPETTMKVTNTLASLFIEENLKVREQYAEGTSEFLSNELDKSKGEVEGYEKSIKGFKEAHMGSLPEQLESNLRTLDRLQMELQNVSANLKNAEDRRIFLDEQLRNSPAGQPTFAIELERMRGELASMLSIYKETYPDVQILKRRIRDFEAQIERARTQKEEPPEVRNSAVYSELSTVKSQIGSLRQREAQIRRQISDYEKRVDYTPSNEQTQSDLTRDYKISLQNYQALLEKKLSARLAENLEKRQKGARFRVIDPANLPDSPDKPDRLLITLLGTLGGGSLGTGLVFLFEILNPAFRKPEDFDGMLPVLTSIPLFAQKPKGHAAKLTVIKGRK